MRTTALFVLALALGACGSDGGNTFTPGDGGDVPAGDAPTGDAAVAYSEPMCELTDLSALSSAYVDSPAGIRAAAHGIAEARYPIGVEFIDRQTDAQLTGWFRQHQNFGQILFSFEVGVHEGQHIWDITMRNAQGWPYRLRDDLVIRTRTLSNFNRNEILTVHPNVAADQYAPVYLMGQSGMQGFNTLLDEYVAYTHSLAARYCTRDGLQRGQRISSRDGILTMMYYVGTYLRLARTNHPDDYAEIVADPEHIRLILTVWQRAEYWLGIATQPELGLSDAMIRGWAYSDENVAEINRLRAMQ